MIGRATEVDNYLLAPESGLWETFVDLGDRVDGRASRSGRSTSSSGPIASLRVVEALTDGIVFVVRAIATTAQGDNVAVIARQVDAKELH